jgi:hypothetical protein
MIKIILKERDLINMILGMNPANMTICDKLTKEGFMKFVGNQNNPDWIWNKEKLKELNYKELIELYNEYNPIEDGLIIREIT